MTKIADKSTFADRSQSLVNAYRMCDSVSARSLSRRSALIGVGVLALSIVGGCATLGRSSEIDTLISELDTLLSNMDAADVEALQSAASKISRYARELVDKHEEFAREFNREAQRREVTSESLQTMVERYESGRVALRNELLRAGEALLTSLPADSREDVMVLMNQKSRALAPRRGQGT